MILRRQTRRPLAAFGGETIYANLINSATTRYPIATKVFTCLVDLPLDLRLHNAQTGPANRSKSVSDLRRNCDETVAATGHESRCATRHDSYGTLAQSSLINGDFVGHHKCNKKRANGFGDAQHDDTTPSAVPRRDINGTRGICCERLASKLKKNERLDGALEAEARPRWLLPSIPLVDAIRLIRLDVPQTAQVGQTVRLRCVYDAKNDKLQSLSWYKNGREFYRYQPSERRQPVLVFNATGVQLDVTRSRNSTITLVNTTMETSGRYKCEATGTSFQEAKLDAYLNVIPPYSSGVSAIELNSLALLFFGIILVLECLHPTNE